MENENKRKIKKKLIKPITDEDIYSYSLNSENLSPNIRALPVRKRNDSKKDLRPINIDLGLASKQTRLLLSGIEVFFPYEPYPNQKIYMEKVIEACKKNTIAGLESPTGTGKTLCLLCASLAYLRYERQRLIDERNNNFDVIDKTEKIKQPIIYYTSRTHAQLANVIQELQKTCYRPINAIISSREQMCVNELIKGFHGNTLNMKCQFLQKRNQCRYFKGKNNPNMTWSAYDGKTIEELKESAKKAKFCPFFFERDKSVHSDLIFLPYNYIFDPAIKKRMNIQMKNSILIIDEAHNIQEVCNDAVSRDLDTNMIEEILSDLKSLKIFLEENEIKEYGDRDEEGFKNGKNSKNINIDLINAEQIKNEINILNNIKNHLNSFQIQSGNKWPNFGMKLDAKGLFDLFYLGSRGDNQKQTTIKFNNKSSSNNKFKIKKNENVIPSSEKTHKSNSDISYDEEEINNSEEEFNSNNNELISELTPDNISKHISYLSTYEFFIHNDRSKRTLLGHYIEILELIKLLGDNFIEVENADDTNPLNNYTNNFRFFIEDITESQNKNIIYNNNKKKSISNFVKKKNRILHIYCFNPGFGFKNIINEKLHATIITSGTLSPIDGMESELKCSFEIKLEGTHVIDKKQVHFGVLTFSLPDKEKRKKEEFIFNINSRNNIQMINNLGETIVQLCKVTPGGILVFFSSYGVMEDFILKWNKAKIISKISEFKVFCQDKHDQKLNKKVLDTYQEETSSPDKKGAILFSVCRGSCSEGMNFKNDAARLVIVVGIPFAYLGDPKTQLRKEYQDQFNKYYYSYIKDKNIKKLSGSEWYNQNAIKCVNQALGRVIRHSNDYGCMLLIDSRYQQNNNRYLISKWIRDQCIIYNDKNNDNLISNVDNFFKEAKKFTNKKIEEKRKLDEMKKINEKKISSKKRKEQNLKIVDDLEDENNINQEEKNYVEDIIKDSIKKIRKNKNFIKLNDEQHFNIINDIKIDEIKDNKESSKEHKEKLKKKRKNIQNSNNSNIITSSNKNDPFIGENLDLNAIFGEDIKNNELENNINENKNNENNININLITNKKKEQSNKDENNQNTPFGNIIDLDNIGISFFDTLKNEKNTTIKKTKPENNSIKDNNNKTQRENEEIIGGVEPIEPKKLTNEELAEEINKKKDNPEFQKLLKEKGLDFKKLNDSQESDLSEKSNSNFLKCPICFRNSNDPNVKIEAQSCGHIICAKCLEKLKEKEDILKCPFCGKKLNLKKSIKLFI